MNDGNYTGKTYAYVATGLLAASAVAFGLIFTALGIYSLIAAVLFALASLAFTEIQKKRNNLKWLLYLKIAAYALLIVYVAFFIGGIIWSAK